MKLYPLIFVLYICTFSFSQILSKETDFLEGGFESKNAFINFVIINGKRYIIKQKKECNKTIISVIRDALAAYIAKDLGITHSVKIISPRENIIGKIYNNCPAALLSIAKGKIIRHLGTNHKFFRLSLQQRTPGGFDEKILDKWLDETIISQITWHKQLPIIVALDLFLCNCDRHRGNLFYDDETDSFCAIDMDNIYRHNLSKFACRNLRKMIKRDHKEFSQKEILALKKVKKTLEFLLQKYTPDIIIDQLEQCAYQAGYVNDEAPVNLSITKKLLFHREVIHESYKSCLKLISILEKIIYRSEI
jgi:hypothetical protein